MLYRLIALIALAGALTAPAAAATPRTVHLYGDSIMKGWGYGHYDDPSALGRIDRIATLLARANGSSLRFNRTTLQAPSEICRAVARGEIKRTDSIVFENAGPHFGAAAPYQAWLEHVVKCATRYRGRGALIASPARLALSTMFDFSPGIPLSTYDERLVDGRSANEVTAQVARASGARLLDWNARMDSLATRLPVRLVHPDGIHPTVFGNIVLAGSIVRREGVQIRNLDSLVDEVVAQHDRLVSPGMAPAFTREQATEWVRVLVG